MKRRNITNNITNNKILIVDGDEGVLEILKLMLAEYDCIPAKDGETAIELYTKFKPALVLTEIVLPKMDGVEVTRKILKIDPDAKIVGVTAFGSKLGKALLEAGAVELIDKPFRKEELLKIVNKHLKAKKVVRAGRDLNPRPTDLSEGS
ncbi:response regulator [Archaeoglobales archaeon]|nr:MAG: response regulator [Archaeoglobales archaeon]